jgi:HK97 family phage portal protein
MSNFLRRFRRSTPETRAVSLQSIWGSGGDWPAYRDGQSDRLGAVQACAHLISSKVADCPLEVHKVLDDGGMVRLPPPVTFTRPFRQETPFTWKYQAVRSLVLRGNAYGLQMIGEPGLAWLNPGLVSVNDSMYPDRAPFYEYRGRHLADTDIVHIAFGNEPGFVRGVSRLEHFRRTFVAGLAAEDYGSDWFSTGGQPTGLLMTDQPITDDEAKTLKARWAESRASGGGIAVMGSGAKYQAIQVTAEEAQFIETQRFSVEQVARIFGVPPEMIGGSAGDSMTYANREQRAIDFVTFTLAPYITVLEEHLSRLLPDGQVVRFNTERLLEGDLKTRLEARAIAIASHQMTPTEARAAEGRLPLTDEQKTELALVPLTTTPTGKLKALPAVA